MVKCTSKAVTGYTIHVSLSLMIDFVLRNSADPGEMPTFETLHLGFRCLLKYPFSGFFVLTNKTRKQTLYVL